MHVKAVLFTLVVLLYPILGVSQTQTQSLFGVVEPDLWMSCNHSNSANTDVNAIVKLKRTNWQKVDELPVNLGFTRQQCWFKSILRNPTAETLSLVVSSGYPLLETIELTVIDPKLTTVVDRYQAGTSVPFNSWPIQKGSPAFNVDIPPLEQRVLVWKISSAYSLQFYANTQLAEDYYQEQEILLIVHSLFFGALLVMIFYNLLLFLSIREKVYLLYVVWALTMGAFQFIYVGFGQRFWWSASSEWSQVAMAWLLPLILIFGSWFCRSFLELAQKSPIENRILKSFGFVGTLFWLLLLVFDYAMIVPIIGASLILMFGTIFIVSARHVRLKSRSAIYFMSAWICLITGAVFMALNKFNLIPLTPLSEYLVELGILLEITLFSLALAERINLLKAESQRFVNERIRAKLEADKAIELNNSKSEFLAIMSHEIRTPMNGILAMAELLKLSPLSVDLKGYVDTIDTSAKSLLRVINDILDYSRIETGKLEIIREPSNIREMVVECKRLFSMQSIKKGIPLLVHVADNVPEVIKIDSVRVQQIINNLLSNAYKFTESGTIQLRVYADSITNLAEPCLIIEVNDTGIGLSQDQQRRLFDSFAQADRTIFRRYGGSGLGLTICKKLSQLMGGDIELVSELGQGARFKVHMPLLQTQEDIVPVSPPPQVQFEGLNVLVAEDNAVNQLVIKRLLDHCGIAPVVKENGQQVLDYIENNEKQIDVILMDCNMPVLDGYETTRRIKANHSAKVRWIIALSANALQDEIERAYASGVDAYITKPITLASLTQALSRALPIV